MAGMVPGCQLYGTWVYPPIGATLGMVGLDEIRVYITRHKNTVAQYITTHTIMDFSGGGVEAGNVTQDWVAKQRIWGKRQTEESGGDRY